MALINERDRATIAKQFEENLVNPVQMIFFTIPTSALYVPGRPGCETCNDVQQLLQEIAGMSEKLSLEIHNLDKEPDVAQRYDVARVPALVLAGHNGGAVRYFGAPAGYEFSTLLQDIQQISKAQTALSTETRQALEAIEEPLHIQVFVTPT